MNSSFPTPYLYYHQQIFYYAWEFSGAGAWCQECSLLALAHLPMTPHRKHEPPLPDFLRCSSSGNMLLRTFRAKLLHVRQLIAAKLEENGRRWSHYWNFSRSRWPRRAMPKVISRLSRRVSAILIHWFMRCMHSSAMCRMLYISFNMNNLSDRATHGLRFWFFIKFCLFIGNRTFLVYLVGTNTFENVLSFFNFEVERYLKYGCPQRSKLQES